MSKRIAYLIAIMITILLGLGSRKFSEDLPVVVAEHAGDMLWAMMVYFGFRFLLIRLSMITAVVLSLLFSFGIEFSQLYQADWINQLRMTTIGALVLGKGFLIIDLFRYAGGILIAFVFDKLIDLKNIKHKNM